MPFQEQNVVSFDEAFFSREDDKPTLWDAEYDGKPVEVRPGWKRVVVLTDSDGNVEIHSDPEIVAHYLDGDE